MFDRGPKQISEEFDDAVVEVNTLQATASRTPDQNKRLAELKTNIVPQLQNEYAVARQRTLAMARSSQHWQPDTRILVGQEWFTADQNGDFVRIK